MLYTFSAQVYNLGAMPEMSGWTIVSLPNELATEIRANFKGQEEGWGRLKVNAKVGNTEWQTAVWFDTKQNTYLLPLKAAVRNKEGIMSGSVVEISILI